MAKKKTSAAKVISNRRARFDYQLGDSLVVGIALNGRETKSLRLGHGKIQGAYVTIKQGELWLTNATINGSNAIPISEDEQTRDRKLLAKKKEIERLYAAKQQGMTIVPTELYTGGRFIKLKIAVAKGKKNWDKRESIKKRDEMRQINRQLNR